MSPQDLLEPDLLSEVIVFAATLAITIALLAMAVIALGAPAP